MRIGVLGISLCAALGLAHGNALAGDVPAQMVVFLGNQQKVLKGGPQLSLFAFFYGRTDVSLLGVYAGPRWTFGALGVEFKTGVYGGTNYSARPILNNQIDVTKKHLSIAWFTDLYPPDEAYSYLSTFLVFGPIYIGGVADVTVDWSHAPYTKYQEGPALGAGTKTIYLGVAYLFVDDTSIPAHERSNAIRMTVGLTL
jgi:hypothetical protein